jgi:uncharacterized membrane protein YphA (DoxX/SURF4 family)
MFFCWDFRPNRKEKPSPRDVLYWIFRFIVGGTFVAASINKIAFPKEFASIVSDYRILPSSLIMVFAYILPWIELILGILLITGLAIRPVSSALLLLLLFFSLAIVKRGAEGTINNCGCFSPSSHGNPQSVILLIGRNLFLMTACLFLSLGRKKMNTGLMGGNS